MPSNDKIYGLLVELSESIGRLEGQGEAILTEAKRTNGRVTELEKKVEKNEINFARVGAYFTIAGFVIIAGFNFLIDWLKAKIN